MKEFFQVQTIEEVLAICRAFAPLPAEEAPLLQSLDRVLAADVPSRADLPGFARSTMDGFAVAASSTFGASATNPALLTIAGEVAMGQEPDFSVAPGQAGRIATGGMLPVGTDAVVMVEHTETLDDYTIEATKSVAPGSHVIGKSDDLEKGQVVLPAGQRLRPQDMGLLSGAGVGSVQVSQKLRVGILSTGDEIKGPDDDLMPGQVRDMNTYALAGQCQKAHTRPSALGIVPDEKDALFEAVQKGLEANDVLLISGGSSMGQRDLTVEIIEQLEDSQILVHGVAISPGKPTILGRVGKKAVWGLPGHVVSAMVVFHALVRPMLFHLQGSAPEKQTPVMARLSANVPSAMGRTDFIRVRLFEKQGQILAEPQFGKSGLIRTMIQAHGLVEIPSGSEGLDQGREVRVFLFD